MKIVRSVFGAVLILTLYAPLPAHTEEDCAGRRCPPVMVFNASFSFCDLARADLPCSYRNDALWKGPTSGIEQGLYQPRSGPPADGPLLVRVGAGNGICVSNVAPSCQMTGVGMIGRTFTSQNIGAYCSSFGTERATLTITIAGYIIDTLVSFDARAGVSSPVIGTVTKSTPPRYENSVVTGELYLVGAAGADCSISPMRRTQGAGIITILDPDEI